MTPSLLMHSRCWNINQLSIEFPFRVPLRSRLTLIRLSLIRKPWIYGVGVFHPHYRYLCLHLLFQPLQSPLRMTFTATGMLPYHILICLKLRWYVLCPFIVYALSLDQWAVTHSLNELLLPSKHPGCLGDWTTFVQLNIHLGTLAGSLGSFPLGHGP